MRILHVVGARPNYMKVAPLVSALRCRDGIEQILLHTGQHYDDDMSAQFFRDLGLPEPDVHLHVGSGTHASQTARVMLAIEPVLVDKGPDLVVVAGDVNSTLAAALTASKLGLPIAHVEAGLRSFDWTMPEEINRVLTDRLSEILLTHSPETADNLAREGIPANRVFFVGNLMIDTLLRLLPEALATSPRKALGLDPREYAIVTLHRPSNIDDPARLAGIVELLSEMRELLPVVFPVHPRTRRALEAAGRWQRLESCDGLLLLPPLGYLAFLGLVAEARLALTDSGGLQEETTTLRVPCLTMRTTTERPITIAKGTNRLVGDEPAAALQAVREELGRRDITAPEGPDLWDGHASERAATVIEHWFRRRGA